jgi:predicted flap endonuclease-1-like 5' DNA nuclease
VTAAFDRIADTVKLSRPAQRALATAGIVTYADLSKWTRRDLANLHGIGPKTFMFLEPAMNERGVAFRA